MTKKTTVDHLNDIRQRVQAQDRPLSVARERRDAALTAAGRFPGSLRVFGAGSLATGYVNHPVSDADGGVVMDRRLLPALGPDGDNELPYDIVDQMHDHVRVLLLPDFPNLRTQKMKRGLLLNFDEPVDAEQDPSVDLVVALNRQADNALWIPNLEKGCWEPSDPERHVALFTSGIPELRQTRAWVNRIVKAWNKQWPEPAFCSFNLAALAWEAITIPMPLDVAVTTFFTHATDTVKSGPTADPAGVSDPIRLPLGRDVALKRVTVAADNLQDALDHDDDPVRVANALAKVFPDFVTAPVGTKAGTAAVAAGGLLNPAAAPAAFRGTRAYGDR